MSGRDDIRATLRLLLQHGGVIELRVLNAGRDGTIAGYYSDPETLARDAARLDTRREVPSIFVTANPVNPALLARAANRFVAHAKHTTSDADIIARRWLLVDLDPHRPAGISSTDAEHDAALAMARVVREWLIEFGISRDSMVLADSGNGAHLLVRIDLPNDLHAAELVKRCLGALDLRLSTDAVHVDTTTSNAARIWKLYGTTVRKGDPTADRPYRRARLLDVPDCIEVAPREALERLAAMVPIEPAREARSDRGDRLDVGRWLDRFSLAVARTRPWQGGGTLYVLDGCPIDETHERDRAAFVIQFASGAIAAGCHHARCTWAWRELRERYEPEAARKHATPTSVVEVGGRIDADRSCVILRRPSELVAQPINWLVDSLLPLGMFAVLHGKDKLGKTLFAWEVARAILLREALFGLFETAPGRVVLALLDDPNALTVDRRNKLGLTGCNDLRIVTPLDADLSDPRRFLADFGAECKAFKPSFIFIDALYQFAPAGADSMNDASRMAHVMRDFDRLAEEVRSTVLLAAHDRKDGGDVAGSHVIRATAKALLHLERPRWSGNEDEEDDGRRTLIVVSKLTGETRHLLRNRGPAAWTYIGQGDTARQTRNAWARDRVASHLLSGLTGTADEITQALRLRKADVLAALSDLEESGDVTRELQSRADGKKGKGRLVYAKAGTFARKDTDGNDRSGVETSAPGKGLQSGPNVPPSEINSGTIGLPREPAPGPKHAAAPGPREPIVPEPMPPSECAPDDTAAPDRCRVCGGDDWRWPLGVAGKVVCGICHPSARLGEEHRQ